MKLTHAVQLKIAIVDGHLFLLRLERLAQTSRDGALKRAIEQLRETITILEDCLWAHESWLQRRQKKDEENRPEGKSSPSGHTGPGPA